MKTWLLAFLHYNGLTVQTIIGICEADVAVLSWGNVHYTSWTLLNKAKLQHSCMLINTGILHFCICRLHKWYVCVLLFKQIDHDSVLYDLIRVYSSTNVRMNLTTRRTLSHVQGCLSRF